MADGLGVTGRRRRGRPGRLGLTADRAAVVRAYYRLTARLGVPPTVKEAAAEAGVPEASARVMVPSLEAAGLLVPAAGRLPGDRRRLAPAGAAWMAAGPVAVFAVDPATEAGRRLALVLAGGN